MGSHAAPPAVCCCRASCPVCGRHLPLVTGCTVFPASSRSRRHQEDVLFFLSLLILSPWRQRLITQVKGSVPRECPLPRRCRSPAHSILCASDDQRWTKGSRGGSPGSTDLSGALTSLWLTEGLIKGADDSQMKVHPGILQEGPRRIGFCPLELGCCPWVWGCSAVWKPPNYV